MNQANRIAQDDRATLHRMSDRAYLGRNPVFGPITDEKTGVLLGYRKVAPGIPFVRTESKQAIRAQYRANRKQRLAALK